MNILDAEAIKQQIDLREFAARYTTLGGGSANERWAPCPRCGGTRRFHVRVDKFVCHDCHPRYGDIFDYIQWLGLASDFNHAKEVAANYLGVNIGEKRSTTLDKRTVAGEAWNDDNWQRAARRERDDAIARLAGPEGAAARAELERRGLRPETWQAYSLGYALNWNSALNTKAPSIVIPWQKDGTIKALNYRFFGPQIDQASRFSQRKGSVRTIFGLDRALGADLLLIVEGELNAISVWQALQKAGRLSEMDVLSFGSQGNAASQKVISVANHYRRVVVWADDGRPAVDLAGRCSAAVPFRSGSRNGRKLDANEFLQTGELGTIITRLADRYAVRAPGEAVVNVDTDPYLDYLASAMASTEKWYLPGLPELMKLHAPDLAEEAARLGERIEQLAGNDLQQFQITVDEWLKCYRLALWRIP